MKKLIPTLVVLVIALVWIGLRSGERFSPTGSVGKVPGRLERTHAGPGSVALSDKSERTADKRIPEPGERYSEARAYRLVLDGGICELEAVEDLSGDFRQPRSMLASEGMFHCRLLDADGGVLAETTMHPPDRRCVVLVPDFENPGAAPLPVSLTAERPVVFQVRLPAVDGASKLEIVRLAKSGLPADGTRPDGELVAQLLFEE